MKIITHDKLNCHRSACQGHPAPDKKRDRSMLTNLAVGKTGPRQTGTGTVGYSDSWVQGQLGTVTDGYRCDSWVQGQTGTSGATNMYRDKQIQV